MKKPDNWLELERTELLRVARQLLNWNCDQAIPDKAHSEHYMEEIKPLYDRADELWNRIFT